MSFKRILFYDNGAGAEGGGAGAAIDDKTGSKIDLNKEGAKLEEPLFSADELKSFGVDSPEMAKQRLAEFIQKEKEASKTEDEKKQEDFVERTNFLKFSAEKGLIKEEELSTLEALKAKDDAALVFEKYCKEEKEDDPELTYEYLKEKFDKEYKLDSDNEKAKARGLSKIQKEAKEIRHPFETKVESAKAEYAKGKEQTLAENKIREKIPSFHKFIDDNIEKFAPEKVTLVSKQKDGDKEVSVPIEIVLTKEERKAVADLFKTAKYYSQFEKGDTESIAKSMEKKIDGWVKANKFDDVVSASKGIGMGAGSTTGAKNSFPLTKDNGRASAEQRKDAQTEMMEDDMKMRQKLKLTPGGR